MSTKKWLRYGLAFAAGNILLSCLAFSDSDIREPELFSDLEILIYPNYVLGLPMNLTVSRVTGYLVNQYYESKWMQAYGNPYYTFPEEGQMRYKTNVFIDLFINLTIYWFAVGALVGWRYDKRAERKLNPYNQ